MRDKVGWNRRNEEAGFGRVSEKDERSKRHECWTRTARDGAGDGAAADGAIAPNDEELEDSPAANDPEVIDLTWIHRLESSDESDVSMSNQSLLVVVLVLPHRRGLRFQAKGGTLYSFGVEP